MRKDVAENLVQWSCKLDKDQKVRLEEYAAKKRVASGAIARWAIDEYLDRAEAAANVAKKK